MGHATIGENEHYVVGGWVGTETDTEFRLRFGWVVVLCLLALVSRLSTCWTTRAVLPNGRGTVRNFVFRTSSLGVCGELLVEIRELRDAAAAWWR